MTVYQIRHVSKLYFHHICIYKAGIG